MQRIASYTTLLITAVFALFIGLYPIAYFFPLFDTGFLSSKGLLAQDTIWKTAFNFHIIGGGIALFIGWIQFWKYFRIKYLKIHRIVGALYIISILFFGASGGIYVAIHAEGGVPTQLGFSMLGILWFVTTLMAFIAIKNKNIESHKNWMIRSYALTFAAVTLRIYMPLFMGVFHIEPDAAYTAISWFCWVPNFIIGEIIVNNKWVKV